MSISKLRVLAETTIDDFPDASTEAIIKGAIDEVDTLRDLFGKLVYSKVISDSTLLADPKVYNQMVEILNRSAVTKK